MNIVVRICMTEDYKSTSNIQPAEVLLYSRNVGNLICSKVGRRGLVVTGGYSSSTGKWIRTSCNPDDIGDFLQYVAWLGCVSHEGRFVEFAVRQVALWNEFLRMPSGFYHPFYDAERDNLPTRASLRPVYPHYNVDTLFGLVALYRLTKRELFLASANRLCDGLLRFGLSPKGFVYTSVFPWLAIPVPKRGQIMIRPQTCGLYIEELCELFEITGCERYLDGARKIARACIGAGSFVKRGFFVDFWFPFLGRARTPTASLMKTNTNMLFGLLALYRTLKESVIESAIIRNIDALSSLQSSEGAFYKAWDTKLSVVASYEVSKTHNHAMIDALIEAYLTLGDDNCLERAKSCADYWLAAQSKIGLFPESTRGQQGWNSSVLDSHVDLLTVLLKLYGLTRQRRYLDSFLMGMQGLLRYHTINGDWAFKVDYVTGALVDDTMAVKFLGGLLRTLLFTHEFLIGKDPYQDAILHSLARDR